MPTQPPQPFCSASVHTSLLTGSSERRRKRGGRWTLCTSYTPPAPRPQCYCVAGPAGSALDPFRTPPPPPPPPCCRMPLSASPQGSSRSTYGRWCTTGAPSGCRTPSLSPSHRYPIVWLVWGRVEVPRCHSVILPIRSPPLVWGFEGSHPLMLRSLVQALLPILLEDHSPHSPAVSLRGGCS